MSSPIHHAEDLDAALMYAPPWARGEGRLERTAAPPLEPPLEPPERRRLVSANHAFSGDLAMTTLQRRLALDPDAVPEPPRPIAGHHNVMVIALRMCAVAGVAAIVAWAMISVPTTRLLGSDTGQAGGPATPVAINRGKPDPLQTAAAAQLLVHHGLEQANKPPQQAEDPSVPVPPPAPSQPVANTLPPDRSALRLDDQEIATLVKRGEDYLDNGDFAAARLLLRRAADAGSANAALALGATFDPGFIRQLGAIGAEPDTAQARAWYQKAVELGSATASQQIEKLAQARQ